MTTVAPQSDAVTHEYAYDIDTIYKEMTSKDYLENRAYWVREVDPGVDVAFDGDGQATITLQRWVTRDYPKALKKLFPAKQGMKQVQRWQRDGDGWKGTSLLEVQGNPVEVTEELTLKQTARGCEYRIIHGVTARIPLLGRRIEAYVLKETQMGCGDELNYLEMRLAGVPDLIPRNVNRYPVPKK